MSTNVYEGMFILDSNKYSQNPDATTGEVLALLERVKANVLASRPWQDGKLAYAMEGHRKGLYLLTYFTCDAAGLTEMDRLSKLTDTIIRHMIIKLEPALVEPMLAMASGQQLEVVSSFRDGPDRDTPSVVVAVPDGEVVSAIEI